MKRWLVLSLMIVATVLWQTVFPPASGGGGAAAIACAATPGDTTGTYRQQCQTAAGALHVCNNAAGCTVAADWVPISETSGLNPSYTSALTKRLTLAAGNARKGDTVTSYPGATVDITAGTGTARGYLSTAGVYTVGHDLTLTCSAGCTATGSVTAFPLGVLPLWSVDAVSGAWSWATYVDYRTPYAAGKSLVAGAGAQVVETATQVTIGLSSAVAVGKFGITVDGGGSAITSGIKGDVQVPYGCTPTTWTILADVAGAIVFDIWRDAFANYPPLVGDSMTAAAKPTIPASGASATGSAATWTAVAAGDTVRFNVDSATTITQATLTVGCSI